MVDDDPDIPTLNSEGYNWKDWLPVLRTFEDHEDLQRTPDTANLEELLSDPEQATGLDLVYEIKDTGGEFQLEYSPSRRSEKEQMLWGTLSFNGDLDGEILRETRRRITSAHATGYLEPANGYTDLAEITVPETYDTDQLLEAVQAGVAIAQDAEELEAQLRETIRSYESLI